MDEEPHASGLHGTSFSALTSDNKLSILCSRLMLLSTSLLSSLHFDFGRVLPVLRTGTEWSRTECGDAGLDQNHRVLLQSQH